MSLIDFFEDAWDYVLDGLDYFISFEWIGDTWEGMVGGVSSAFIGLTEFSILGMAFGLIAVGVSYLTKYLDVLGTGEGQLTLIGTMLQGMPPTQRIIWSVVCWAGTFFTGYLVGSAFDNS